MKAIVLTRYGSPTTLELRDVAKPEPGDGEVLVKVHATAVNDWDWCFVRGKPFIYRLIFGLSRPKVSILGAELAGTVAATGNGAADFQVGDRVYGDVSEAGFGGFAEYACVKQGALARMPDGMTFDHAAALPHAALLALQGLVDVGQIQYGESVLINGAGGGVGTIGVQIAKQHGATVTGVDSARKLGALSAAGFDHVIDYEKEDFTRAGRRYDLILDTKTTRSPFSYLRALNAGGRYVTVGGHLPRLLQAFCLGGVISRFSGKHVRILALKPNQGLDVVSDLFKTKGLQCLLDGPYPLRDVPMALQRFGNAEHVGKIVITVSA